MVFRYRSTVTNISVKMVPRCISISLFAHRSAAGQVGHVGKKIFTVHSKIYGRRSFPLVYFAAVKKYCSSRSIQQLLRSISPQSRCGGGGGGAASARGRGSLARQGRSIRTPFCRVCIRALSCSSPPSVCCGLSFAAALRYP